MRGPLGNYGIARSLIETPGWLPLEAEGPLGEPESGGGGGRFGFSLGGRSNDPFHPDNFPTQLDPTQGPSYGLPSIWNPEYSVAETNAWAKQMGQNEELPQFMRNTFTDPMALRQGKGVYHMDVSNLNNRPSDLTGPAYEAKRKAFNSPENVARMQLGARVRDAKAANVMGGSGSTRSRGSRRGRNWGGR